MGIRGAVNWTVSKVISLTLLMLILAVILIGYSSYPETVKGNLDSGIDRIQLFLGFGSSSAQDKECLDSSRVSIEGVGEGSLKVCRDYCELNLFDSSFFISSSDNYVQNFRYIISTDNVEYLSLSKDWESYSLLNYYKYSDIDVMNDRSVFYNEAVNWLLNKLHKIDSSIEEDRERFSNSFDFCQYLCPEKPFFIINSEDNRYSIHWDGFQWTAFSNGKSFQQNILYTDNVLREFGNQVDRYVFDKKIKVTLEGKYTNVPLSELPEFDDNQLDTDKEREKLFFLIRTWMIQVSEPRKIDRFFTEFTDEEISLGEEDFKFKVLFENKIPYLYFKSDKNCFILGYDGYHHLDYLPHYLDKVPLVMYSCGGEMENYFEKGGPYMGIQQIYKAGNNEISSLQDTIKIYNFMERAC
jgi:hypothetical protein